MLQGTDQHAPVTCDVPAACGLNHTWGRWYYSETNHGYKSRYCAKCNKRKSRPMWWPL